MKHALTLAAALVLWGCEREKPAPPPPAHDDHARHDHAPAAADAKVTDPVCHMTIAKGDRKAEFHKADWYFCSDVCLQKFKADPAKFAKACACATAMKKCDCAHCGGKREPCACP